MWKLYKKEMIAGGLIVAVIAFALGCVFNASTGVGGMQNRPGIEQKADIGKDDQGNGINNPGENGQEPFGGHNHKWGNKGPGNDNGNSRNGNPKFGDPGNCPNQPGNQTPSQPGNQTPSQPGNQTPSQPGNQAPSQPGDQAPSQPGTDSQETPSQPDTNNKDNTTTQTPDNDKQNNT